MSERLSDEEGGSVSASNWWCQPCQVWHPKTLGNSPAAAHAAWATRTSSVLTEEELAELRWAYENGGVPSVVEAIVAAHVEARLAEVRALADEWQAYTGGSTSGLDSTRLFVGGMKQAAMELRATLGESV